MSNVFMPSPTPPVRPSPGLVGQWQPPHNPAGTPPPYVPPPAPTPPQNFPTINATGQPYIPGATYPTGAVIDRTNNIVYPAGTIRHQGQYITPTNPNYGYLQTFPGGVNGDPFFMQQQGLLAAQNTSERADVAQQAQRALIDYGAIPAGELNPLLGVTDATRQLAEQNTGAGMSTLARIQHAAELARQGSLDKLAARGMLSSGETGFQLGELGLQRQQAEYDALQQVMDRLFGMQSAFGQSDFNRRLALFDAAINAYGRQANRVAAPQGSTFRGTRWA